MKIRDLCANERPREKMLEKGASTLSSAELLAILLRTGTGKRNVLEVAQILLKQADGRLDSLATMSVDALCGIDGIGPSKAVTLVAAFELGRRWFSEGAAIERRKITSPEDVFHMMFPLLRNLGNEECWVLYLNSSNICLGKERLSVGGMEATVLDTKILLRRVCEKKASGVILIHNHPSGNSMPSVADINQTRAMRTALKACGISLVDHVIIGLRNYYSFSDETIVEL